jgi:hypothetical protein
MIAENAKFSWVYPSIVGVINPATKKKKKLRFFQKKGKKHNPFSVVK